jgi:hypothetical protein
MEGPSLRVYEETRRRYELQHTVSALIFLSVGPEEPKILRLYRDRTSIARFDHNKARRAFNSARSEIEHR